MTEQLNQQNILLNNRGKLNNKKFSSDYFGISAHDFNNFFANVASNQLNVMPQIDVDTLYPT
nr:unnamed protein product [Callosobruchus analis]